MSLGDYSTHPISRCGGRGQTARRQSAGRSTFETPGRRAPLFGLSEPDVGRFERAVGRRLAPRTSRDDHERYERPGHYRLSRATDLPPINEAGYELKISTGEWRGRVHKHGR